MFPGCGWGWGLLLYRVLGWASRYKAVLFACMSDYPSNPCCLKKKKRKNTESSKIISFASWYVSSRLKKYILKKTNTLCVPKQGDFPSFQREGLKKNIRDPLEIFRDIDDVISCRFIFLNLLIMWYLQYHDIKNVEFKMLPMSSHIS